MIGGAGFLPKRIAFSINENFILLEAMLHISSTGDGYDANKYMAQIGKSPIKIRIT